jgi:radical SAM protein with 4Fe4S-binding SPASM domain
MDGPFLLLHYAAGREDEARRFAIALDWDYALTEGDTPSPEIAGHTVIEATPREFSAVEADILRDALNDHRYHGAAVTLPNATFTPWTDFRIGRPNGAMAAGEWMVNCYVPLLDLTRRYAENFASHAKRRASGLVVALAEKCNLRCGMCPFNGHDIPDSLVAYYRAFMERRRGRDFIALDDLRSILEVWSARFDETRSVSFFGPGEPFRYPRLHDVLDECARRDMAVSFTSNGTLLDQAMIESLLHFERVTITVSLDAVSSKAYRAIRTADLERVTRSIDCLLDRRSGPQQVRVLVSFIRQSVNEDEEETFAEQWLGRADEVLVVSRYYAGRPDYGPEWTPRGLLPCAHLENSLHVLTDGDAWGCSAGTPDEFAFGNIFSQGLDAILTARQEYVSRRAVTGAGRDICRDCLWWRQTQHREIWRDGRLAEVRRPYSYRLISPGQNN